MRINTLRLKVALGILGALLPIIVLALCLIFGYGFPNSISATYYIAPTITPFMIILGASSILLMCYDGYELIDDIVCTTAGVMGLGICLFPCFNSALERVGTFQIPTSVSAWLHNGCAVVFFSLLAFNSLFLFTKSSGEMTKKKKVRNIIYRVCGIGMIASFVLLIPFNIFNVPHAVWIIEAIALFFFGISWLTKADVFPFLFCDTAFKDE